MAIDTRHMTFNEIVEAARPTLVRATVAVAAGATSYRAVGRRCGWSSLSTTSLHVTNARHLGLIDMTETPVGLGRGGRSGQAGRLSSPFEIVAGINPVTDRWVARES